VGVASGTVVAQGKARVLGRAQVLATMAQVLGLLLKPLVLKLLVFQPVSEPT